jgi:hypothetical protein
MYNLGHRGHPELAYEPSSQFNANHFVYVATPDSVSLSLQLQPLSLLTFLLHLHYYLSSLFIKIPRSHG